MQDLFTLGFPFSPLDFTKHGGIYIEFASNMLLKQTPLLPQFFNTFSKSIHFTYIDLPIIDNYTNLISKYNMLKK